MRSLPLIAKDLQPEKGESLPVHKASTFVLLSCLDQMRLLEFLASGAHFFTTLQGI